MAIPYVMIERKNAQDRLAPRKVYAQVSVREVVAFVQLADEIAANSGAMNADDVLTVLYEFAKLSRKHLQEGKMLHLNNFGSFRLVINSSGAEDETQFDTSLISKKVKLGFTPSKDLKEALAELKYEQVESPQSRRRFAR